MKKQIETYSTFDLGLAVSLVCLNFKLIDLDKSSDPKKVKFIFEHSENINEVVNHYWNDELQISARRFFDNQKMLKNRLHSQ